MKLLFRRLAALSLLGLAFPVPTARAQSTRISRAKSQLQLKIQKTRQWIVIAISSLDLDEISQRDSGWFIADFQPTYPGREAINEKSVIRDGVHYIVPNSATKPLFVGKYVVLISLGARSQVDGSYLLESNFPHFRNGSREDFYGVDAEPLLFGGVGITRLSEETAGQPISPVIAIPKEWSSDIKTAVEKRRQDPTQGQLEGKSADQLLEMLATASPVESFPILKALLPQFSGADEKQRNRLSQIFTASRGLKRAVRLSQIVRVQSDSMAKDSLKNSLNQIFDKSLAEKMAAEVSDEDAVSLLVALEVVGVRTFKTYEGVGFGFDLLRAIAAQTRFKTLQNDDGTQIRRLLREMGAVA